MSVALIGQNQREMGTVSILEGAQGIVLTVEVEGFSPGWHGFHIHEIGDCSDYETFKTAGGHAAAIPGQDHGFLNENSPHLGDLPNIWVNQSGSGKAQFFTPLEPAGLKDLDGSAFVLHSGADDYKSEPAGDAGDRVACGVIYPPANGIVE